jgi:murein DD-endopeptidase MepM/ murein hydrolase activator NlpD
LVDLRRIMFGLGILFLIGSVQAVNAFEISSPFGWRDHPISGERNFHTGIDIKLAMNTPISPIFSGKVIFAGVHGGYGKVIVIYHGNNTYTLYGHLNKILVTRGRYVQVNRIMAYSGSTGYSTGPHLHLAYWVNGKYVDPLTIWRKAK